MAGDWNSLVGIAPPPVLSLECGLLTPFESVSQEEAALWELHSRMLWLKSRHFLRTSQTSDVVLKATKMCSRTPRRRRRPRAISLSKSHGRPRRRVLFPPTPLGHSMGLHSSTSDRQGGPESRKISRRKARKLDNGGVVARSGDKNSTASVVVHSSSPLALGSSMSASHESEFDARADSSSTEMAPSSWGSLAAAASFAMSPSSSSCIFGDSCHRWVSGVRAAASRAINNVAKVVLPPYFVFCLESVIARNEIEEARKGSAGPLGRPKVRRGRFEKSMGHPLMMDEDTEELELTSKEKGCPKGQPPIPSTLCTPKRRAEVPRTDESTSSSARGGASAASQNATSSEGTSPGAVGATADEEEADEEEVVRLTMARRARRLAVARRPRRRVRFGTVTVHRRHSNYEVQSNRWTLPPSRNRVRLGRSFSLTSFAELEDEDSDSKMQEEEDRTPIHEVSVQPKRVFTSLLHSPICPRFTEAEMVALVAEQYLAWESQRAAVLEQWHVEKRKTRKTSRRLLWYSGSRFGQRLLDAKARLKLSASTSALSQKPDRLKRIQSMAPHTVSSWVPQQSGGEETPRSSDEREKVYAYVTGEGPETVVMIHGLCMTSKFWKDGVVKIFETRPAMMKKFTFVVVDLMGHGRSVGVLPAIDYSLKEHVERIDTDIIKEMNLETFHLVAHSFGSLIAIRLAALHPRRVRSITNMSPAYFESTATALAAMQGYPFPSNVISLYPEFGRYLVLAMNRFLPWSLPLALKLVPDSELPGTVVESFMQTHPCCVLGTVHAILYERVEPQLRLLERLRIKVLIFHGTLDGHVPIVQSRKLAERYSNIQFRELQKAAHHFPLSHRRVIADLLEQELLRCLSRDQIRLPTAAAEELA